MVIIGHVTVQQPSVGRRIKAAKELGGFDSLEDLARQINLPNLSAKSLRRSANDQRDPSPHELEAIARACRIAASFFVDDLAPTSQQAELLIVPHHGSGPVDVTARLDRLEATMVEIARQMNLAGDLEAIVSEGTSSGTPEPGDPQGDRTSTPAGDRPERPVPAGGSS